MLSYKEWLEKYGQEACNGCLYNIPQKAKCTYKGTCARYDAYRRDEKRKIGEQLTLF